jgi:hypothetical protein
MVLCRILCINGIYDIVCSVSILYFPLSLFGQLHIGMIIIVPLCSDIVMGSSGFLLDYVKPIVYMVWRLYHIWWKH